MARPVKPRTLDSFPHPCSGRRYWNQTDKLAILEAVFGPIAYAFYFKTLEMVYQQEDCTLVLNDVTRRLLLSRLKIRRAKFDQLLEAALGERLFDPQSFDDRRVITNRTIERTAAATFKRREAEHRRSQKRREAAAGNTPETPRSEVFG